MVAAQQTVVCEGRWSWTMVREGDGGWGSHVERWGRRGLGVGALWAVTVVGWSAGGGNIASGNSGMTGWERIRVDVRARWWYCVETKCERERGRGGVSAYNEWEGMRERIFFFKGEEPGWPTSNPAWTYLTRGLYRPGQIDPLLYELKFCWLNPPFWRVELRWLTSCSPLWWL